MGDGNNNDYNNSFLHNITFLLVAASTAAFVVICYHFITVCWYNRRSHRRPPPPDQEGGATPASSVEISVAELIPAHKYRKSGGGVGGGGPVGDDGEAEPCAVCLCDFEEGEELRTLPECAHSFHAPCIDMWLYSHSTCPVCRTDATPPPTVLRSFVDSGSSTIEQNRNVAPNFGLHFSVL